MNLIKSDRVVMVDCDDTLILWDKSEYDTCKWMNIECYGHLTQVVPHFKNIKLLHKFIKLGYTVVVWSASGWEWAQAVVIALELESYVSCAMSKPRYYFDDIRCEEWMGPRIWRDPLTGNEST